MAAKEEIKSFDQCFNTLSPENKKVQRKHYLAEGKIPVIDQGEDFIGGYTNDHDNQQDVDLPVILFGDHTRRFKYVDFPFAVGADGIKILKPIDKLISDKFAYYQLTQKELPNKGYSRHYQFLRKVDFWVPTKKGVQEKIVETIETQFTRLDAAIKSLKAIKSKLELYRKSVLKAAFSKELIYLKGDWQLLKIKDIAQKIQYGLTSQSGKNYSGPRYLRITDIQNRKVNWDIVPFAKEKDGLEEYRLNKGDVVFARTGATVGKSFLIDACPRDAVFASYLIRIVPNQETIVPAILWLYFQSPMYWHNISERQRGIGQPNVNGTILSELDIYLPVEINDQRALMEEIESRFSVIDKIEQTVDVSIEKAEKLQKSILKCAFDGKLVN